MKINKTGTSYEFLIDGPIGEASPLFNTDVRDATFININCEKMTYINSIGVKNWILWTVRVPKNSTFLLTKAPLVMINQCSTVVGFMPSNGVVQSFSAPFACASCGTEKMVLLTRGQDFDYPQAGKAKSVKLPQMNCTKCNSAMEPDFIPAKVFAFLDRK